MPPDAHLDPSVGKLLFCRAVVGASRLVWPTRLIKTLKAQEEDLPLTWAFSLSG
jgi:hypothetical protein